MQGRVFISTFILIFLAELGDKTQLAAMARAAGDGSAKWIIFLGASAALVCSTLIAILFGSALTRVVPENYIKAAAGILFIVFGILLTREAFKPRAEETGAAKPGIIGRAILYQAAEFEKAAFEDYRQMATAVQDQELRSLLVAIADEEDGHFRSVTQAGGAVSEEGVTTSELSDVQEPGAVFEQTLAADLPIVNKAIEHELATAGFYNELARLTPSSGLRATLTHLSTAERKHAVRLQALRDRLVGQETRA